MRQPRPTTFPHSRIVTPTERGKGVGFVTPNFLAFAGSVVVLDVKGENLRKAARQRELAEDAVQAAQRGRTGSTPEASE